MGLTLRYPIGMRLGLRKSFRLPGGVRVNVSSRGVNTSWGIGGLRFSSGSGRRSSRRGSRAGGGSAGSTSGCLVLIVGFGVLVVVSVVVKILMTPWPWIALGGYLLFVACRHLLVVHAEQRTRWAVLATVSAQAGGDAALLRSCLAELAAHTDRSCEAALLLVAHRIAEGAHDAAFEALSDLAAIEGEVVSPQALVLRFPGIPVPVALAGLTNTQEVARILQQHVLVQMGKAQEVVSAPRSPHSPLMVPLAAWVQVEAYAALTHHALAASASQQALLTGLPPPWTHAFLRALADAHEAEGHWGEAAEAWQQLAVAGDLQADASLKAARAKLADIADENRRRADALAEQRQRAAEAERRKAAEVVEQRRRAAEAQALHDAAEREAERRRAAEVAEQRRRDAEALALRDAARREVERQATLERARVEAIAREVEVVSRSSDKILAAKTPAGRRSALQAGLASLTSPERRQELLVVAARADVEAVIAKAAALKSVKAKRRHLEEALAALRADVVPDDLQAQEIALLEQSLETLEVRP